MPTFHAIVAMSEGRVIANQGKLPWHLPEEYRWFKHKTIGGTLIMGRKTRESIGRALPKRTNLVLSREKLQLPDAKCFPSVESLLASLPENLTVWVVGGTEIYRLFLPRCTFLYISQIKGKFAGDVFFPPYEDQFVLNQVIHENADFRVERWLNREKSDLNPPSETYPAALS